jgi:glutathione S-transferase
MLTLHLHPLASYCWKVLLGLYENETPFRAQQVDLSKTEEREALQRLWPVGKFPVLTDGERVIAESTTILEYVAARHPGACELIPPTLALEVRAMDRFFDLNVHEHLQKIVDDRLRPAESKDPLGVSRARERLGIAYGMLEGWLAQRTFAAGAQFTMADCAAGPALHYANKVQPLGPVTLAYLQRLEARPSFVRVLREAAPYAHFFPA